MTVRTGTGPDGGAYGELPITIGSADLTGLKLTVQPLPDIPVIVSGGDSRTPGASGANVSLRLQGPESAYVTSNAMRKGDSFVLPAVKPGAYQVVVQPYGGGCLAGVSSGSMDLLRSDLTVSPGASTAPINVTLRNDCGSITAKIDDPNQMGVVVMLDGAPSMAKLMNFAGGTMQIPQLTPGDYTIYAASNLQDLPYADPEVMKMLSGQKVTVGPNAQAAVQLKLIDWPGDSR